MHTLRDELAARLTGRVCLVGIGNTDRGDDGFGVRLAEGLHNLGCADVLLAGQTPERWVERLARGGFGTVMFLDAVDMRMSPGSVAIFDAVQIVAQYPQVSTHRLSLGMLARLIETDGGPRVFLLGVQPCTLACTPDLSAPVCAALEALRDLLAELLARGTETLALHGEQR